MNYREVEIYAPKDLGTTGTEVIDIKVRDVLSSIELVWQTTVVTAALMTAPHVACISKIELVDGSDVLFSLSGEEAQALAFYGNAKMPLNRISLVAADYMQSVIPIYFGRKLLDKQLALDPTKFKNPQLKVTWDEDAANAAVVANQLTVRGWAFDEKKATPIGFLMSKEVKSYTPVVNAYVYTDLAVDHPYRLIMIRSKSTTHEPGAVLAQVKLSEDHDKRIPVDMTGDEIIQKICVSMGEIEETIKGAAAVTATDIYAAPTAYVRALKDIDFDIIAAGDDASQITIANNKLSTDLAVLFKYYWFVVKGYCPHSCIAIPFGDLQEIDDWYDVTKLGSLRLTTQGAAAVGTSPETQIITQQLRKY